MKKHNRKLSLARETLASLQSDALAGVGGGNQRTLSWTCETQHSGVGETKLLCVPPPPG